jgi:tetratricopeptide (TPR) repeat protein
MVGSALYYLGRCDQAIEHCRKSLKLDPGHIWARIQIAHCLLQQGRYEDVMAELRLAQETNRHDTNLSFLGYVYAVVGRRAEARQALAELETESRRRHVSPIYRARIHAGLGEKDRAIALLRQAYDERSDHVLYLNTTPFFDSLRSDPRFVELLRRIGLPQ